MFPLTGCCGWGRADCDLSTSTPAAGFTCFTPVKLWQLHSKIKKRFPRWWIILKEMWIKGQESQFISKVLGADSLWVFSYLWKKGSKKKIRIIIHQCRTFKCGLNMVSYLRLWDESRYTLNGLVATVACQWKARSCTILHWRKPEQQTGSQWETKWNLFLWLDHII